MAEITARSGTWSFDGDIVRIVPGHDRAVHKLRQILGEVPVPLEAVLGIALEPGRKGGRVRLRLRVGADPLLQATGGRLADETDPYQLTVDANRVGVAEYFVDEVRNSLLIAQIPSGPCDRYLLPGPPVPVSVSGYDGTATFDGERVRLEWNWATEDAKKRAGSQEFTLRELTGVEWTPSLLRFRIGGAPPSGSPSHDPHCLSLWGFQKDVGMSALLAAAVTARLPHPAGPEPEPAAIAAPAETPAEDDHDVLLRRLRELGDLRREGILTEEEFSVAKQAVLRRL
ncbi:DUF4429 domain-containing protein [Rhizohabitans arisaemae]|uniref:DUF4429 domain-containing protein n=1 Tax=Rhizohabitans arisaemae TaxID=2720610 RepID=UPI0024B11BA8|nr:DUF4429 domain-containing protein [Rhizohabitans arisaemae]